MKKRVVVTGMGTVNPLANNLADFWIAIREGRGGLGPITRFDASDLDSRVAAEVKSFNPEDFMDSKEVKRMALFSQYAVAAARMAWQDAGFATQPSMERTAVLFGNGIGGNDVECEAHERRIQRGVTRIPPLTIPKVIVNEAAGNISMSLGIEGPVLTIVTACASGTDAIGGALDLIRCGRADVVVTGGTEACITPYSIGGFAALKALSTGYNDQPTRASRPFDKGRDGFVMGEGAGALVVESLEHAQARGARIYAELAGYAATGDAFHLTAPHPDGRGAIRSMRLAVEDAGARLEEVDYINAHGTSTPINDPTETKAIKQLFGQHAYALKVSSTKSMTGHCIGAAGAIEAIVCILGIRDGFYAPTINLDEPDPECDLNYVPNRGIAAPMRLAISNSLGFGGHNSTIAFKEMKQA